jgi:glutamate racemase
MLGVFDSGVGGLGFLKNFTENFPDYDFMYLGDQLRVPYGGRSTEAIQKFTEKGVKYLWDQGCSLVIVACNTASAEALRYLQEKVLPNYPQKKVLGILIPAVEKALENKGTVGVIATKATVKIGAYKTEILARDKLRQVYQKTSPLSVPLIEEGLGKNWIHRKLLKKYLRPLKNANTKNLILACTHYPLIKEVYQKIMGKSVNIIDPAYEACLKLKDYLKRHPEIHKNLTKNQKKIFLTTDNPLFFDSQARVFYGKKINSQKIDLT